MHGNLLCTHIAKTLLLLSGLSGSPEGSSHPLVTDMRACQDTSRAERAVRACSRLLNNIPLSVSGRAGIFVARGNAYAHKSQFDRALSDFTTSIQLNNGDARAYFYRGTTYTRMGMHRTAIIDYTKTLELKPGFVKALFNRGTAFGRTGQISKAIEDFSTVIKLKPNSARAFANRGTAFAKLGQVENALADYASAIELNPRRGSIVLNRATLLRQMGRIESAKSDYLAGFKLVSDTRIRRLQKNLKANSHYSGTVDGRFDEATEAALRKCLAVHSGKEHPL